MSRNIKKIIKLNDLVSIDSRRKHTIVLNPEGRKDRIDLDEDIVYDKREWRISEDYSEYIKLLSLDNNLSTEDKILKIYEKIACDYIYDDNLISYIKKVDDDTFTVPDWYARDTDDEWAANRVTHKRRVCYELARYLAKSLTELLKDNDDYSVCIHWNKELTHYFVGLTCSEYSITLDPDDFFNIKDLTRLKTGLTAQGIKILEDKEEKFEKALKKFNKGKSEHAIKNIEFEIIHSDRETEYQSEDKEEKNEDILLLKKAIQILAEKYDLDSQGIFEYMKEIVDIKLGSEKREKIWKKVEVTERPMGDSTRFIRCLVVTIDGRKFLIDGEDREVRQFDEKEFEDRKAKYIRYKDLPAVGRYYDGR